MRLKRLAGCPPGPALWLDVLEDGPERGRDIGPAQAHLDICLEESHLVAAIVAGAIGLPRVARHAADQPRHGIGELNLAAGAGLLSVELGENVGRQDVAADDAEPRRRA